jgi:hypothetical protein
VACPSCGGTERVPIALGYWECVTPVEERRPGLVPDPSGAVGATMPVVDTVQRPCSVRYHEGAGVATTTCACGTFGIGVCAECGKVICGDHSQMSGGQRLCREHGRIREEASALAAAQARLTVEKFLALAAAVGNPGLETWTMEIKRMEPYTYRSGFVKKTGLRPAITERTELTFWYMHTIYSSEYSSEVLVLYPDGRTGEMNLPIRARGHRRLDHEAIRKGDRFSEYRPEVQDKILREMCRMYKIPI